MAQLSISFDAADIAAYQRDMLSIFIIYGACDEADVQPHLRSAFREDVQRAGATLAKCMNVE